MRRSLHRCSNTQQQAFAVIFPIMIRELRTEELRLSQPSRSFSSIAAGTAIIGQEKAMSLLKLGLSIDRVGYNIFLSGEDGSGRLTAVLEEIGKLPPAPGMIRDAAYVWSGHSRNIRLLMFPAGKARAFQADLLAYGRGLIGKDEMLRQWPSPEILSFLESLPPYGEENDAYRINIVADRTGMDRRPAIIETHPSHQSLFGSSDKESAPHLSIRVGSYQLASGGFLIMNAEEITGDESLWKTLKRYLEMTHRALSSNAVPGEMTGAVRPAPIPMLTKIILTGTEDTYNRLIEKDDKFVRYFRIAPEFDFTMPRTEENMNGTVSYLKAAGSGFLPADDGAYNEILRYSSCIAEDRDRLTTELSLLGDLMEEANLEAEARGKTGIEAGDVVSALGRRSWHASLSEETINEEIRKGDMVIALSGTKTGIVNGLAVMDRGVSSFGTPAVISATVAPGSEGIVNIEHEAGLSGGIHDKGLLILEGYLRHRYAKTFPLSLYAGICFEQSYAEVDGDSASLGELYALLSAIADIPIRQDIAVTGSVSQMGALQPVGGINEKIQGFFNACSISELTGSQGVMIPVQNISSLILPRNIEKAIDEGMFHIYAISEVDDGIELLTGMKSGKRDRKGSFPLQSFNRRVEEGLRDLCRYSQDKG